MALTDNERAAIRLHLGYSSSDDGVAVGFGIAHVSPQHQVVELAMAKIKADSEPDVRQMIVEMDEINCAKRALAGQAGMTSIEGLHFNGDALGQLNELYRDAGTRLADLLGITPNPFSAFWKGHVGGSLGGVREGCW